jgi:hypothetical protein
MSVRFESEAICNRCVKYDVLAVTVRIETHFIS